MRTNILFIIIFYLFISCNSKDDIHPLSSGFLAVVSIEYESEIFSEVQTRTIDENLIVELWKGGELLRKLTADEMQNKINLEVAVDYSLKIYSSNYSLDTGWTNDLKGEPVYYIEVPFEVEDGKVTSLNIKVPMINFGVTLDLSEIIGANWIKEYTFYITVGDRIVELYDGETAYFSYSEGVQFCYNLSIINTDDEKYELNDVWGDSEEEKVNSNTLYTIVYNLDTYSLLLK